MMERHKNRKVQNCHSFLVLFVFCLILSLCVENSVGAVQKWRSNIDVTNSSVESISETINVTSAEINPICLLPQVVGPCRARVPKFFFNVETNKCQAFFWGGCEGNGNNFETISDCQNSCEFIARQLNRDTKCTGPAQTGKSCFATIQRWTFNTTSNQCEQVIFGGCGATENNFESQLDCQMTCGDTSHCSLDKDSGRCFAMQKQWFYNTQIGECEEFDYGGCGGNMNKFQNRHDCEKSCRPEGHSRIQSRGHNCDDVKCPGGTSHYKALGCVPVYEDGACCPTRFDCPDRKIERNNSDQCVYNGKLYNTGQPIAEADSGSGCRSGCICSGGGIVCAHVECPSYFGYYPKEGCRIGLYKTGSCCPYDFACGNETATCNFEGKTYIEGEKMYPKDEPCLKCYCKPGFNGTLSTEFCEDVDCGIQVFYSRELEKGCTPVYFEDSESRIGCCPISWKCPETQQTITTDARNNQTESVNKNQQNQDQEIILTGVNNTFQIVKDKSVDSVKRNESESGGNSANNVTKFPRINREQPIVEPVPLLRPQNTVDICTLPRLVGECRAVRRRYYSLGNGTCEEFMYSGCKGNANNFESLMECKSVCGPERHLRERLTAQKPAAEPTIRDPCTQTVNSGRCRAFFPRYYFDVMTNRCVFFIFGGCQRNGNNFYSKESCEATCLKTYPNICETVPLDLIKNCGGENSTKFYYDAEVGYCKRVISTGCGSSNIFNRLVECDSVCGGGKGGIPRWRNSASESKNEKDNICHMPKKVGPCFASVPSFYYDVTSQTCQNFTYSGCFGNLNRFESLNSCRQTCESQVTRILPKTSNNNRDQSSIAFNELPQVEDPNVMRGPSVAQLPRVHNSNNNHDNINQRPQIQPQNIMRRGRPQAEIVDDTASREQQRPTSQNQPHVEEKVVVHEEEESFIFARMANNQKKRNVSNQNLDEIFQQSEQQQQQQNEDENSNEMQKSQVEDTLNIVQKDSHSNGLASTNNSQQLDLVDTTAIDSSKFTVINQRPQIQPPLRQPSFSPPTTSVTPKQSQNDQRREVCSEELRVGNCNQTLLRFYWDSQTLSCRPFKYTGCSANRNHFTTEIDCRKTCDENYQDITKTYCEFGKQIIPFGKNLEENEIEKCGTEFCTCSVPPSLLCIVKACPTNIFNTASTTTTTSTLNATTTSTIDVQ